MQTEEDAKNEVMVQEEEVQGAPVGEVRKEVKVQEGEEEPAEMQKEEVAKEEEAAVAGAATEQGGEKGGERKKERKDVGRTGGTVVVRQLSRTWDDFRFHNFVSKKLCSENEYWDPRRKGPKPLRPFVAAKKKRGAPVGTITFAFEEDRDRALELIRGASVASAHGRTKEKHANFENQSRDVRDSVAPLWRLAYGGLPVAAAADGGSECAADAEGDEAGTSGAAAAAATTTQLEVKQRIVVDAMRKVTEECDRLFRMVNEKIAAGANDATGDGGAQEQADADGPVTENGKRKAVDVDAGARKAARVEAVPAPEWVQRSVAEHSGLPGEYIGIVRSPVVDGYRNKVEFTVGPSAEDAEMATVGFNVGLFKDGHAAVGEPSQCPNISQLSKALAAAMESYLRKESSLKAWDKRRNAGFWRILLVREAGAQRHIGRRDSEDRDWKKLLLPPLRDAQRGSVVGVDFSSLEAGDDGDRACAAGDGGDDEPQLLVLVQVNDTGVDDATVQRECSALADRLDDTARAFGCVSGVTALLVQYYSGVSNRAPETCTILPLRAPKPGVGRADDDAKSREEPLHIHETLSGLQFRVSPTSFFQVNTLAAENLYAIAGDWLIAGSRTAGSAAAAAAAPEVAEETILFDVCSGTGTIGLTLAKRVGAVVGVELCKSAVRDSWENAKRNGIQNARFIAGKAETVLPRELHYNAKKLMQRSAGDAGETLRTRNESGFSNVVAIVDPPRSGLHKTVLRSLKKCRELKRLVYISCNPESCANDLITLCGPEQRQTAEEMRTANASVTPFTPVRLAAVDLFPHSKHCESIILLSR